jgi:hypothetical protein
MHSYLILHIGYERRFKMKKLLLIFVTGILLVSVMGFALGALDEEGNPIEASEGNAVITSAPSGSGNQGEDSGAGNGSEEGLQDNVGTGTQNQGEGDELQNQVTEQNQVRAGNYETAAGKQVQIQEQVNNRLEIQSGNVKAQTGMQLMNEGSDSEIKLKAELSNGRNAEIKVMPDAASETALEKLKLKNCVEEEGCTIELMEVGKGDDVKPAYEIQRQRTSRVLGLFKANMDVQAQVDAETGELLKVKKPWWAFLASEPQE